MLSFNPSSDLIAETQYTLRVSTGATDAQGNPLEAAYTVTFTTVGTAATVATPGGFSASAGLASVTLTWDTVTGADQYNLYWSTTPGGAATGTKIADVTSPHTHSGLTNGETYYYAVTAEDEVEEGAPSGEQSAMAGHVLLADVPFADSNLANADFWPSEATYADEVYGLSADYREKFGEVISDLSGIEYLWNLGSLSLRNNAVTTLEPLANLQALGQVNMSGNASLANIESLSTLPELGWLDLSDCPLIEDISALSTCTWLTHLYLAGSPVSDLSPLEGLYILMTLDITNCPVSDSSSLAWMEQLSQLHMGYTSIPVAHLSFLSGLWGLSMLDLSGYSLSDLSFLLDLSFLWHLRLAECGITSIPALSALTSLERLDISDNMVSDLSPVMDMSNLSTLSANGNSVVDVSTIGEHGALEFIYLRDNLITTGVTSLVTVPNVKLIDLRGNSGIPPEDIDTLREALWECEIIWP